MFRCYSYTVIRERINLCLLKLQLLKQSIKIHRCGVNTVVVWLHILGPYWCLYVALFGSRLTDCFNSCNFSVAAYIGSLLVSVCCTVLQ